MANHHHAAVARSKPKVLSVSRDDAVLRTRSMVLQNAGYRVCQAADYDEAIQKCTSDSFDVAVLGASLSYDHRVALAAQVKKFHPQTPVVMFCRIHEPPSDADRVIDPFDGPGALLFAIESALDE